MGKSPEKGTPDPASRECFLEEQCLGQAVGVVGVGKVKLRDSRGMLESLDIREDTAHYAGKGGVL